LEHFDHDKKFTVYGFGGTPEGSEEVSHCFPLNGLPHAEVHGIDECLETYKNTLPTIKLLGPTFFGPILAKLLDMFYENVESCEYSVILILTDGMIHDMKDTKTMLVEMSKLPVSLIIIGIGDEDFSQME
jgi:hypothetical protein